ncbi:MAG: prohibitin family protein [Calditerrivibrio sp.]|nr:prohibitin family protein [Calditerrivibrio sp.]MCA1932107.1 prohibitin family protein [Calditerrivibrio sp.]
MSEMKVPNSFNKLTLVIPVIVFILVALFLFNPFFIINAGERGVILTFGKPGDETVSEGLHFKIPLVQTVVKMDVKVQKSQTDADSASKDLQDIHSIIAVNYHIVPEKANVIYKTIGLGFKDKIIDPAVQEVVKAVTAKYTAVELITLREKVRNDIKTMLRDRLAQYNITVDDFSIINFKFSQQFTQAIEQKQTAEQLALKAQRDLDRIKIEAEQKITQARAEAESLRIQKENVSPLLVELRKIEANLKAIEKWDGVMPKVTGGALPFIDVEKLK